MNQGTIGEAMITVADLLFWSTLIFVGIFYLQILSVD